jgi:hypothetical protein
MNDYIETENDRKILLERIRERIDKKRKWFLISFFFCLW